MFPFCISSWYLQLSSGDRAGVWLSVSQREGESSSNYIEDALEFVQLPRQLNQINSSCSEVAFSLQIDGKKQYDKT